MGFQKGFLGNTRSCFEQLVHAGQNHSRPYLDWMLLSQLRSLCITTKGRSATLSGAAVGLSELFTAATAQVHRYAFSVLDDTAPLADTTGNANKELEQVLVEPRTVKDAEAFFQALRKHMGAAVSGSWGSSGEDWSTEDRSDLCGIGARAAPTSCDTSLKIEPCDTSIKNGAQTLQVVENSAVVTVRSVEECID